MEVPEKRRLVQKLNMVGGRNAAESLHGLLEKLPAVIIQWVIVVEERGGQVERPILELLGNPFAWLRVLAVFAAVVTGLVFLAQRTPAPEASDRDIRVTVPENLDYAGLFADLFEKYTVSCRLLEVKTVNMGSLFRLHYQLRLKNPEEEKQLLDAMRCRNGNLEISCGLSAWEKQRDIL